MYFLNLSEQGVPGTVYGFFGPPKQSVREI
jgi:hypothetical protein